MPDCVQVTGTGDFTKINVKKVDYGGGTFLVFLFWLWVSLDPHGAGMYRYVWCSGRFLADTPPGWQWQSNWRARLLISSLPLILLNPLFSLQLQYHEWTTFISDSQFCMRACTGVLHSLIFGSSFGI